MQCFFSVAKHCITTPKLLYNILSALAGMEVEKMESGTEHRPRSNPGREVSDQVCHEDIRDGRSDLAGPAVRLPVHVQQDRRTDSDTDL